MVADFIAPLAISSPRQLFDALFEIGVSKFSFGPQEAESWTVERLRQEFPNRIEPFLQNLLAFRLEDLTIQTMNTEHKRESKQISTWILNQDSIETLLAFFPSWPEDGPDKQLAWVFLRGWKALSFINDKEGMVFQQLREEQVSTLRSLGLRLVLKPQLPVEVRSAGFSLIVSMNDPLPTIMVIPPTSGTCSIWDSREPTDNFGHPDPPHWRRCAACDRFFHESSARVERLGLGQIDICTPCLKPLFSTSGDSKSKEEVLEYLRTLAELIERVPASDFGRQKEALLGLSTQKRVAVLRLLKPDYFHHKLYIIEPVAGGFMGFGPVIWGWWRIRFGQQPRDAWLGLAAVLCGCALSIAGFEAFAIR